ncbi:universal stress protein [Candidatus Nitrosotenuis aquarius]|uniref:universal stress protein n=1 Tax=Candidatus Nitrosotenuis aquarius TaxID=1846278 RepID=UPI000C1E6412|nr:universal stress protein [Candidatus Nitrosotenuis aquarius]
MADKIQKILVPLDGSDNSLRGLRHAITVAQPTGATITGLYVVNIHPKEVIRFNPQQRKKEISFAERVIAEATNLAARSGVNFKPKTDSGNPAEKITKMANDGDYDLVVIGSRGRGARKEMFLGSVSNHVLHKADAPVMIVK